MRRNYFLTLSVTLLLFGKIYGQEAKKGIDFIIVINDDIAVGSVASVRIELIFEKTKEIISASYYPGRLSFTENEFAKLMSDSIKVRNLNFTYYEHIGEKQNIYNYTIELKKEWLDDYFNILRIYDFGKKKYKGKYKPCGVGKNYAYEIESPSHSFKLIEKNK